MFEDLKLHVGLNITTLSKSPHAIIPFQSQGSFCHSANVESYKYSNPAFHKETSFSSFVGRNVCKISLTHIKFQKSHKVLICLYITPSINNFPFTCLILLVDQGANKIKEVENTS